MNLLKRKQKQPPVTRTREVVGLRKVMHMASLLKSTMNTRALPTSSLRYIRSDAPLSVTPSEVQWLLEHQITMLVDLRSEDEVQKNPCPLAKNPSFVYHHLPVTGGGDTPASREDLYRVYRNMVDGQMERILQTILNAPVNVMYFCAAGKDRTGVVSALLLRRLGYGDDVIIEDYLQSGENLMPMLEAYVQAHPEVNLDILVPREENILNVLNNL